MKVSNLKRFICLILILSMIFPLIPSNLSFGFVIRAHAEDFQPDVIQEEDAPELPFDPEGAVAEEKPS